METRAEEMMTQTLVLMLVMVLVMTWIIVLRNSLQVCSISRTRYSILKDVAMLAKAHYKVANYLPTVECLFSNYKLTTKHLISLQCSKYFSTPVQLETKWYFLWNWISSKYSINYTLKAGLAWSPDMGVAGRRFMPS